MQIEDIIEELQKLERYCEILENPDEFFRHMQGHRTELSFVLSSFDIASMSESILQSLEKQLPKKPLDDGMRIPFSYYCPACHKELSDDGYKPSDNYCYNCGQKIERK